MNNSKYKLAICIPFDPALHGMNNNSSKNICSHYLVYEIIEPIDFINNIQYMETVITDIQHFYDAIILDSHPVIRNYEKIMNSETYFVFNIIQDDMLDGEECVGYIKTFWLKLIQRKWKRIFKERKEKIRKLSNPRLLMKRETSGK